MEDKLGVYTVRVERTKTEVRNMTVLGTSEADAEENAKTAVDYFCLDAVLQDSEWEDEGDEYDEYEVNEVEDWNEEFGQETADEFRQRIAELTVKTEPEPVDLGKLFAAGWKVDVGAGGPFGKGRVKVRVYPEGEKIGTFGFGDTVELAVRDAAKFNEALTAALKA